MDRVREWLRRLSFPAEFAMVFFAVFGLPLVNVARVLVSPEWWLRGISPITNTDLLRMLVIEVGVGYLLWRFLVLRGWSAAQVGLSQVRLWEPSLLRAPLVALGLVLATYVIYILLGVIAVAVRPQLALQALTHAPRVVRGLPMATVLAVAVINAPFEELFECGYVISSLRERIGVASAINVSAGIRVALHLYQGPIGVLSITPFALIAAIWFARTRQLAPLILAHALVDFTGLSLLSWR